MSRNPVPDLAEYPESPDLALLSAYLDDALSAVERAAVDQRIVVEPALRSELNALRQTQLILRSAPILTVPRDFTLDPAQYGRGSQLHGVQPMPGRALRLVGALGTVAAIAAALIIVFTANFGASAPVSNTVLVASNPTAATPSAGKVDVIAATITFSASPTRYPIAIPSLMPTSIPATVPALTAAAAAVAQSGGISSGQATGGNASQDSLASSPQPTVSSLAMPSNGAAPNAPQVLIAPSATLRNGPVLPISAPTSAKGIATTVAAEPPPQSPSVSISADLPTVLKLIFWVLIGLFDGKGLGLR